MKFDELCNQLLESGEEYMVGDRIKFVSGVNPKTKKDILTIGTIMYINDHGGFGVQYSKTGMAQVLPHQIVKLIKRK